MAAALPISLSVNLNKVALLRNQRDVGYPSVLGTARMVVAAGAHGITVHPRPDERHIRLADVRDLAALIAGELGHAVEFNIEGYPSDDFIALVGEVRPRLRAVIREIKTGGARVSLFMDPDPGAMAEAATVGADRIELYTGPYAQAFGTPDGEILLGRYAEAALAAEQAGLGVNAGHDLSLDNLPTFCRAVPQLVEVSIGHAITADALRLGFPAAVAAYLRAISRDRLAA
jgi:pyridoxine 5-phosphate synthase